MIAHPQAIEIRGEANRMEEEETRNLLEKAAEQRRTRTIE